MRQVRQWCVATLVCALSGLAAPAAAQHVNAPNEVRYVTGRLLVKPRPGLTLQELDNRLKPHGARRAGTIPRINIHIIQLPANANARAVAALLNRDRHIEFVELDEQVPPSLTPNDPYFASGWHLAKLGAPQAWDRAAGEGVTIAILDSGVDPAHPDLSGNVIGGYNAYDNNTDTRDVYGHGTKVAGAAAMAGNNLLGGTGMAFNSRIMPIRVTDTAGYGYFSTMANGLVWAADRGARVASLSFLNVCRSASVLSAAQYMRSKGGVVTGAAGNTGIEELITPSASITCVSAVDSADTKASWSSYGGYVDVAAPGVGIYTTTNGGGYGAGSGTSFSAPITAGVYALMIAANPALAPSELDAALFATAVDLGNRNYYGNGRIDAAAAVAHAVADAPSDTAVPLVKFNVPAAGSTVHGLVAVDVGASDNVGVTRVELYADDVLVATATGAPYGFSWDTSALADGYVTLAAKAFDAAGNVGGATLTVAVSQDTTPPSVAITNPLSGSVVSGPTAVSASATDNQQVAKVRLLIDGREVAVGQGSSVSYLWDPYAGAKGQGRKKQSPGSHSITAVASDLAGNAKSTSVTVSVP